MSGTVFISYTRSDQDFVLRLYSDLKVVGIHAWLDQIDIKPGEPWDETIERALRESTAILVILTPESTASNSVLDEISLALNSKKRVVPVLLRDCAIPLRVNRLHQTDFRGDYASALSHLVATLSSPSSEISDPEVRIELIDPVKVITREPVQGGSQGPSPEGGPIGSTLAIRVFVAVGIIAVLGIAIYAIIYAVNRQRPGEMGGSSLPSSSTSPDFRHVRYDDRALENCRGNGECLERKSHSDQLRLVKDWKAEPIQSPLLEDCMGYPPCVQRMEQAERLRSVQDFKEQPFDSPLFADCMNYGPCLDGKNYVDKLRSIKDWTKLNYKDEILKHCMNYPECTKTVSAISEIMKLDFKTIPVKDPRRSHCFGLSQCLEPTHGPTRSSPTPEPSHGSLAQKFDDKDLPSCCDDLPKGEAEKCRAYKRRQGQIAYDCTR